jgi:phosphoglycolate phosphatase
MRFEYVIFDLDGTISDPSRGIVRSINYALCRQGYPVAEEALLCRYIGIPLDEIFESVTGHRDQRQITTLVNLYRERYEEAGYAENSLYPGVAEALVNLRDCGYSLGVCTSKREDFAEAILHLFEIRHCFEFVDGGDIGVKKHQQLNRLLVQGRISPRSLMIGDRQLDLAAARKNSLASGGVLWGFGSRQELLDERPDFLFDSPAHLITALT